MDGTPDGGMAGRAERAIEDLAEAFLDYIILDRLEHGLPSLDADAREAVTQSAKSAYTFLLYRASETEDSALLATSMILELLSIRD